MSDLFFFKERLLKIDSKSPIPWPTISAVVFNRDVKKHSIDYKKGFFLKTDVIISMSVVLRMKNKKHRSIINLFFMICTAARATSVVTPSQVAGGEHGTPSPATNNNHLTTTYCGVTANRLQTTKEPLIPTHNKKYPSALPYKNNWSTGPFCVMQYTCLDSPIHPHMENARFVGVKNIPTHRSYLLAIIQPQLDKTLHRK